MENFALFATWILGLMPLPKEVFLPLSLERLSGQVDWTVTHSTHENHQVYTFNFKALGVDFTCQFFPSLMKFKFPEDAKETLGPGGLYRLETALKAILYHNKRFILETHGMKLIPKVDVEKRLHKAYLEHDLETIEKIRAMEFFLEN